MSASKMTASSVNISLFFWFWNCFEASLLLQAAHRGKKKGKERGMQDIQVTELAVRTTTTC